MEEPSRVFERDGGSQKKIPGLLMMKLYVDDVLCIGISLLASLL